LFTPQDPVQMHCNTCLAGQKRSTGTKPDAGKNRLDLIPMQALWEIGKAFTAGAAKHGEKGWLTLEDGDRRYFAALLRHALKFAMGEKTDPDSGLSHLTHVATNAIMLLDREMSK